MPEAVAEIRISSRDFQHLSALVKERFGLVLDHNKEQMVTARLSKRLRELHYTSFTDYYRHVTSDASGGALKDMVDALTTKFTSFFREPEHFALLRDRILAEHSQCDPLRVWSAACSTGEEPYSIAITLLEALDNAPGRSIEVVASDISARALKRASAGLYQAEQVATVPKALARKYFLKGEGQWSGWYRVKPAVRELIEFRQINLMDPLPAQFPFSVIFCRNVMIYFDRLGQESVVNRLAPHLEPNGYLFIGHAEGLAGVEHPLRYIQPAVYKRGSGRGK
ncbi:MAG: protein-glutamate O-methyltransferase CheR [Bryobacteraceae bacterium]|jgi:chemotaxis protein methyltransferase CheR